MSRLRSDRREWSVHVAPEPDEPLSAWLSRTASAHGQSLHRFGVDRLNAARLALRDIDAYATSELLATVEAKSGLSRSSIAKMTLPWLGTTVSRSGVAPWVLPLSGRTQRSEGRFGEQACTACLATNAAFRKSWRLAFVVACDRHRQWLVDACPSCGAPISAGVESTSLACSRCRRPWAPMAPCSGPFFSEAFSLQTWLEHALETNGMLAIGRATVPLAEALAGFRFLMRLDRKLAGAPRCRFDIERMRTVARIAWLERLGTVLRGWPEGFIERTRVASVSREPFRGERCPSWLTVELAALRPVRARKTSACLREDPLLAVLRRRKPRNWRSRHAYRLCALARAHP